MILHGPNVSGQLTLEWIESGGPEPTVPAHEGFGTKLLRSGARQFQGVVDCRFERAGLRCRLSLFVSKYPEREIVDLAPPSLRSRSEAPLPSANANFASPLHVWSQGGGSPQARSSVLQKMSDLFNGPK